MDPIFYNGKHSQELYKSDQQAMKSDLDNSWGCFMYKNSVDFFDNSSQ